MDERSARSPEAGAARARGRDACRDGRWRDAYEALSEADRLQPLEPDDLESLATAAYMLGRSDAYFGALERAHQACLDAGDVPRAVRCAFWVGANLAREGEVGPASGWLGRAQRLLEGEGRDCVEWGYLLLPEVFRLERAGDFAAAAATASRATQIGERFGDRELFALAAHTQGQMLIRQGLIEDGLALLDEAMVAATAAQPSPIVTGIVYCGVILACQEAYELRRAQEWTDVLTGWCDEQPEMVAFTGRCLLHRAEILHLRGAWAAALQEARRAVDRSLQAGNRAAAGEACYRQGEVHRLRGRFAAAETAYREASRWGREPQPGLALLRLAQGDAQGAAVTIRRVTDETADAVARAGLLPAYVEIMLAADDPEAARSACVELEELAQSRPSTLLDALAARARGHVELAGDDAQAAAQALRRAWRTWEELEAPYEAARTRELIALARRGLGDEDTAALERDAAAATFERLGAAPDVERTRGPRAGAPAGHGLTPRELEVLALVAAGRSNRDIAGTLVISEHTVARHLQNIFAKLGVSSRTAASAYAFEHQLV